MYGVGIPKCDRCVRLGAIETWKIKTNRREGINLLVNLLVRGFLLLRSGVVLHDSPVFTGDSAQQGKTQAKVVAQGPVYHCTDFG
jgi:hypothetical protein